MPLRHARVPGHDAGTEALMPGGLATRHVAETGSTNSDLLAEVQVAASTGMAFAPRLLVAARQTAGRGRHGRRWESSAGASLTFSLAWPFAATVDLSGLSLAVGVALAEALDPQPAGELSARRIGLKWPNDLWLVGGPPVDSGAGVGRKLGGVLIETAPCGAAVRVAVIGVGLNVREQAVDDAASGVACLAEIDAAATPDSALHSLLPSLTMALRRFERDGFAAFARHFDARDLLRGQTVGSARSGDAGAAVEGVAVGVTASGELLLETAGGTLSVCSGEVRLRPLATTLPLPC